MNKPALTVVIPAFNEERFIARQLATLRRHTAAFETQVIVVDNGSSDRTVELARTGGADLVLQERGSVAAVRNAGARHAAADVLMFIDADVFLTEAWARRIGEVIDKVRCDRVLTGSWVSVPPDCTWLERYWFKPLEHGRNTHMNSGHMIVSKALFDELGGFDATLETGEDFDFSMRARAAGATLIDDVALKVIHEGYPKSVREFMRREIWHGTGDCQSVRTFFGSRVAVIGFLVLHGLVLGWALSLLTHWPGWGWLATVAVVGISLLSSLYRYRRVDLRTRTITTLLYVCYFLARGLSLYAAAARSNGTKSTVKVSPEARH